MNETETKTEPGKINWEAPNAKQVLEKIDERIEAKFMQILKDAAPIEVTYEKPE